mmetsp:Transcript_20931/g.45776  ORF Transcript_20931/g.45776 Transcript_20931/m.45776 type:complete len:609 (+) Transcript_20931:186-2012(+)
MAQAACRPNSLLASRSKTVVLAPFTQGSAIVLGKCRVNYSVSSVGAAATSPALPLSKPSSFHMSSKQRIATVVQSAAPAASPSPTASQLPSRSLICTSVTATTVEAFTKEIQEAEGYGVDIVELRLDFIKDFDTERDLPRIMSSCTRPFIVTYRPKWEGGNYEGPEPERIATLKYASILGAPFVDVEYKAASLFFASSGEVPISTRVILSSHNFQSTPEAAELQKLARDMHAAGADIVKIATMANDVTDSAKVLSLLKEPVAPTVALAMGEKGVITRLLANKYGTFLTFAAMSPERASAPGQPNVQLLQTLFNFEKQGKATKLFGIVGNPVSHSRSPLIHNTAFQHIGFDGVYVPLLVDDLHRFLAAFKEHDFYGFSVTIPHKEAALQAASEVDPVAKQIGAVNTLIRQPDGSFKGFNTDWSAAISAIERKLAEGGAAQAGASPLKGKTFVVIGAGGAGRALAFGAASKGAKVVIANRNRERAEALARAMGGESAGASVADWDALARGEVRGDVLANSTSVGMAPKVEETPVPAAAVKNFGLVFDAVYTPVWTQLLKDARDAGVPVVDGLQMFVGQAVDQFVMFTGGQKAPVELMEQVLVDAINKSKK